MHVIAAKAVCFKEALSDEFKDYSNDVINNAKILSDKLMKNGFKIFSGGTDTHLMLVDLREFNITGKDAEASLVRANITCNKNGIPFDTQSPMITSGIRLGTPACTTRGFGPNEFNLIGDLIFFSFSSKDFSRPDIPLLSLSIWPIIWLNKFFWGYNLLIFSWGLIDLSPNLINFS